MGYSRKYGLWSELWVTVGTMGYNRNYGYGVRGWKLEVPCWPVIVMNGKLGKECIAHIGKHPIFSELNNEKKLVPC